MATVTDTLHKHRLTGLELLIFVVIILIHGRTNNSVTMGFSPRDIQQGPSFSTLSVAKLGLYDSPLPPRPLSQKDSRSEREAILPETEEDIDSGDSSVVLDQLFSFGEDGKEGRALLPPLKRRLDSGVSCYYEHNDRLVLNLIEKTSCHPDDACWALEACEGDITEAWTRISTARRMILNRSRNDQLLQEDEDYDDEDYEVELIDEFQRRKKRVATETKKRQTADYFTPSAPDAQWLPTKNPKPVNDEPWFTG
jgi:hypothetical protein